MKEHNYDNLHLDGTQKEIREMVHNQRPVKFFKSPFQMISALFSEGPY